MTSANIYQIKVNRKGERYISLGRFSARLLKKQLEQEFKEDLGFCIRSYNQNPERPSLLFFREKDISEGRIRGVENLDNCLIVYVNIFEKHNRWIMKIGDAMKGGELK